MIQIIFASQSPLYFFPSNLNFYLCVLFTINWRKKKSAVCLRWSYNPSKQYISIYTYHTQGGQKVGFISFWWILEFGICYFFCYFSTFFEICNTCLYHRHYNILGLLPMKHMVTHWNTVDVGHFLWWWVKYKRETKRLGLKVQAKLFWQMRCFLWQTAWTHAVACLSCAWWQISSLKKTKKHLFNVEQ